MQSKEQLLEHLKTHQAYESDELEFKESWQTNFGRSISAIANGNGGWLVVGVHDQGHVLKLTKKQIQKYKDVADPQIGQHLKPFCAVQSTSIHKINNGHVLLIEIINPKMITLWNDTCYKRTGASTTEMSPAEKKQLELNRPELDFSSHSYNGGIDESLVLDFSKFLTQYNGSWKNLSAQDIISKLGIEKKNAAGILFGNFKFRLIHYNAQGEQLDHDEKAGLYHLLKNDFIQNLQSRSRKKPMTLKNGTLAAEVERPYSEAAIREGLVNAVAHATFERRQGGARVDVFHDRLVITNYCSQEAEAFINKRLSPDSAAYNPLLMKILRMANFSEETGSGKGKILKHSIENGQEEPLFEYKPMPHGHAVWRLTLYNTKLPAPTLEKLHEIKIKYKNQDDKYKIASAVVLWQNKPLARILEHLDGHYKKILISILDDDSSPFYIYIKRRHADPNSLHNNLATLIKTEHIYIYLKKWGNNKIGPNDDLILQEIFRAYAYRSDRDGQITNREIRNILNMDNRKSNQIQIARLCQRLKNAGLMTHNKSNSSWQVQPLNTQHSSLIDYIKSLDDFKF